MKIQLQTILFYAGFVGMEFGILIITLVLPLTLLSLGSEVVDIPEHGLSLGLLSDAHRILGGVMFLINLINILYSHSKKGIVRILILVLNVFSLLGIVVFIIVVSTQYTTFIEKSWNLIEDEKTIQLLRNYFSCCNLKENFMLVSEKLHGFSTDNCVYSNISHQETCYKQLTSPLMSNNVRTFPNTTAKAVEPTKPNPFYAEFICIIILLLLHVIATIVVNIYWFIQCNNSDKKESKNFKIFHNSITKNSSKTNKTNKAAKPKSVTSEKLKGINWFSISQHLVEKLDDLFERVGELVGKYPQKIIFYTSLFALSCGTGIIQLGSVPYSAHDIVPESSEVMQNRKIFKSVFDTGKRVQNIIVESEDLLHPEAILKVLKLDSKVKNIENESERNFTKVCYKFENVCLQRSILELWKFDKNIIANLTHKDILKTVNAKPLISPIFGDEIELEDILGNIKFSSQGKIEGAGVLYLSYLTKDTEESWEDNFIDLHYNQPSGFQIYVNAQKSLVVEMNRIYGHALVSLGIGGLTMFIYTFYSIGRLNFINHRFWVAVSCLITIGMAIMTGFGITASFGIQRTHITTIALFLVLAIGIDDMFIIVETWDKTKEKSASKIAICKNVMKRAGVSILVTSLTDVIVFLVGSSGAMSMFQGFNLLAAVSIISLFVYQCTFLLAVVVLDQQRQESLYDGCLLCYKHGQQAKPNKIEQTMIIQWVFDNVMSVYLLKNVFKAIVLCITIGFTAFMAYSVSTLKVHLEMSFYISGHSYTTKYFTKFNSIEKTMGIPTGVYVVGSDLYQERNHLKDLFSKLEENPNVYKGKVKTWLPHFEEWMKKTFFVENIYLNTSFKDSEDFTQKALQYFHTSGKQFAPDIRTKNNSIVATVFHCNHINTKYSSEDVEIMQDITRQCDSIKWTNARAFPYTEEYIFVSTGDTALSNTKRNLIIGTCCIIGIVLLTVMSVQLTLWILLSVLLTLLDVAGTLPLMGITIEMTSTVGLLLSVGLAVDYSAHYAHNFFIQSGSRNERAAGALKEIGPAVFNGGFSTFLVGVFLSYSKSYSFVVFFKITACVVLYGLWHGLFFLPVVLSLIGPKEYTRNESKTKKEDENTSKELQVIENVHAHEK